MKPFLRRAQINRRPLFASLVFFVALAMLPSSLGIAARLVVAWDASAVAFLSLTWPAMLRATPERMRWRARMLDDSRWSFLMLTAGTACISLLTTAVSLHDMRDLKGNAALAALGMAAATILLAWAVMQTAFALHYAHIYYDNAPDGGDRGGFAFPAEANPDYWDFFYASTVIGMTNQVSDVQVTSRAMRRLVAAHSIMSFFFNTVVLALTINMIAGSL